MAMSTVTSALSRSSSALLTSAVTEMDQKYNATGERLKQICPSYPDKVKAAFAACAAAFRSNEIQITKLEKQFENKLKKQRGFDSDRGRIYQESGFQCYSPGGMYLIYRFDDPEFYFPPSPTIIKAPSVHNKGSMFNFDAKRTKEKTKMAALIALVAFIFADFVALGATIYFWIYPAAISAKEGREVAQRSQGFASFLKSDAIQIEGDQKELRQTLTKMSVHLTALSNREKKCRFIKLLSWTCLSAATVGVVHACVAAIGASILKGYVSAVASAEIFALYTFCLSSCSPPILAAIAAIAAVGVATRLLASFRKDSKDQSDRFAGLIEMNKLNVLLAPPLPVPVPQAERAVEDQPGSVPEGRPPPHNPDAKDPDVKDPDVKDWDELEPGSGKVKGGLYHTVF